jgi:hypothetical protein
MEETSYFLSFRREIFILYGLKKEPVLSVSGAAP